MELTGALCASLMTVAVVGGGPPKNLDAGAFKRTVQAMWHASPTFRRQCLRVALQRQLRVTITADITRAPSHARAITDIRRERGVVVRAHMVLFSPTDVVELIAHEMEHVIEQIEGVSLRFNSCDGTPNLRHQYESCRAIETGRRVAREAQAARRAPI